MFAALRTPMLGWMLLPLVWLAGCAELTGIVASDQAPLIEPDPASLDYPDTLSHAGPAKPEHPNLQDESDLWGAIRSKLVFADLDHRRVAEQRVWLARYPDRVDLVTERGRPFMPEIYHQIHLRGLPTDLAILPAVESGYRIGATSRRGAAGLWQFMPGTARLLGLRVDGVIDDRRGFSRSTAAALDHLQALADHYEGDWLLAVAAYNCGRGCVDRARARAAKAGHGTQYWDLDLPRETERYVPRWIAMVQVFSERSPEFPPLDPRRTLTEVIVYPPVDLDLARELSGLKPEEFDHFNARYKEDSLLPVVDSVWLPADKREAFTSRLAAVTPEQRARRTRYRVQRGDSLWKIARRHAVTVDYLCRINGFSARTTLQPGQILKLVEAPTQSLP
jgi:membrane-bound lytic murein transglycosylase D